MSSDIEGNPVLPTGRDVLVVEDDPRVRKMLEGAMREMNFAATFALTAEAALKLTADREFDILILDLNLPGMSGIEFLEKVRQRQSDIQAIILTGFGDLEVAKKAIHLDVVEFLTKPCTLGTLEVAMARALKRRKGQIVNEAAAAPEPVMQFEMAPRRAPVVHEAPPDTPGAELSMEAIEQKHILDVLKKNNGNRAATAAELGISVRKLYYRLGEYQKKGLTQ
jgi:DNA-binding NtrC family response regulator